ncbi:hypothetical protein QBC44DRAFT_144519 [Cladorrhinum sp. PSN332]|nr:hypothetical protein QBC44DRAFT_144519 [Cladorrhinum sp. PSN332]
MKKRSTRGPGAAVSTSVCIMYHVSWYLGDTVLGPCGDRSGSSGINGRLGVLPRKGRRKRRGVGRSRSGCKVEACQRIVWLTRLFYISILGQAACVVGFMRVCATYVPIYVRGVGWRVCVCVCAYMCVCYVESLPIGMFLSKWLLLGSSAQERVRGVGCVLRGRTYVIVYMCAPLCACGCVGKHVCICERECVCL